MQQENVILEFYRWSFAAVPGIIFHYAKEIDLDIEDIGLLASLFYTLETTRPLIQSGITVGQVLQVCPFLTKQKLASRLNRLKRLEVVVLKDEGRSFNDKRICIEPLMDKLALLVTRDHPYFARADKHSEAGDNSQGLLNEYRERIVQLELQLEEEKRERVVNDLAYHANGNYKKVADFISKKTGNLLSVKMASELKKWLEEMGYTPEFLLCMLELCFERNIFNPRHITEIAQDIKNYSINTVEGLEIYFKKYVDAEKNLTLRTKRFDPDIIQFGTFTGIDMNADARRKMYHKWRYDWGFTHAMIMKAGELMCQRTKNGGLEYIDSVLHDWMSREIRSLDDVERELREMKNRSRRDGSSGLSKKTANKPASAEYETYIPPLGLEEIKTKV
ncbi:DnaD domain protein [Syntrophomonas palmitatica]|uniref:DnaD domain-containing protein n=1 Tax=Syntrophomonas palmitatica TaxID=402877 RepID=UPI0006CF42C7|nr:DnaD domain protein [Syntrophomonas palmitatica]